MDKHVQAETRPEVIPHSKLNPVQRRGYNIFVGQVQRCTNPNVRSYKHYGAKGLRVEYSKKDFIRWYEENAKEYDGKPPQVGRIDHEKGYSFDNIRLEGQSENAKERWTRKGRPESIPQKKVGLFSKMTDECIAVFASVSGCARFVDTRSTVISRNCRTKNPKGSNKHSWYYRFV